MAMDLHCSYFPARYYDILDINHSISLTYYGVHENNYVQRT